MAGTRATFMGILHKYFFHFSVCYAAYHHIKEKMEKADLEVSLFATCVELRDIFGSSYRCSLENRTPSNQITDASTPPNNDSIFYAKY